MGVISGLRDDSPAITMADKHDWTWVTSEYACHSIDIVRECAQGILHRDDVQAIDLQQRNRFAPARPVSPGAVDDHHCWSLVVTPHGLASTSLTPTSLHVTQARGGIRRHRTKWPVRAEVLPVMRRVGSAYFQRIGFATSL